MKVLHLFDRYLNTTMNWAYHFITRMEGVDNHIAAPILIDNAFLDDQLNYFLSPLQKMMGPATDEWHISWLQKGYAKIGLKPYKKHVHKWAIKNSIDVVHAHFAKVGCEHLMWIKKSKIPFVVSFYGYDYEKLPFLQPKYHELYRELWITAQAVICEGAHGKQILMEHYNCPESKIHVIPIGVDVQRIAFHSKNKASQSLSMIQVATYTEKKGHIYTLEAFKTASLSCPNMTLTMAGEDWESGLLEKLKNYVQKNALGPKVTFLDFIPYEKLHETLKDYHILVQPSVYAKNKDCEGGAPVILLDAMATGMPVLGTHHCDIPNIVEHNINGWICPSREMQCLSKKMVSLYEMPPRIFETHAKNARKSVVEQFDIFTTSKNLVQLYTRIHNEQKS